MFCQVGKKVIDVIELITELILEGKKLLDLLTGHSTVGIIEQNL